MSAVKAGNFWGVFAAPRKRMIAIEMAKYLMEGIFKIRMNTSILFLKFFNKWYLVASI
jgi:hypothetical protein